MTGPLSRATNHKGTTSILQPHLVRKRTTELDRDDEVKIVSRLTSCNGISCNYKYGH